MTAELLFGLAGLALLDSLNASTLFLAMVILLAARRPVATSASYLAGAAVCFFALAVGLYVGAQAAEAAIADAARWIRRGVFGLLAVWLFWLAHKRLCDRRRKSFALPSWFGPLTALPLGAAATLADLPNAFPLFIAVERLVSGQLAGPTALQLLAAYTVVYAVPVALVIVLGAARGDSARSVMRRVTERFLRGTARRSIPLVVLFGALGLTSIAIAVRI